MAERGNRRLQSWEVDFLGRIADRAVGLWAQHGGDLPSRMQVASTLMLVHGSVCPLRLDEFLVADDGDFAHDIGGIIRHFDVHEMELRDCFMPRFAAPVPGR